MSRMVGSYNSEEEAIRAIEELKTQGYHSEDISVLSKDKGETKHVTEETGTHAGEGAAAGALTGGALGGLGGVLAGIGALAIPGIGPIVAAGPIVAGLTGAAAGAGVGGLAGALIGAGIPEDEAKEYEGHFKNGGILVMVNDSKSSVAGDRTVIASEGNVRNESGKATDAHAGHRSSGHSGHDLIDDEARTAGLGSNRDLLDDKNRSSGLGSDEGLLHDTERRSGSDNSHDRNPLIGGDRDTTIRGDRDSFSDDNDDPAKRGRAGL